MNSTTGVAEKLKTLELKTHLNVMMIKKSYEFNYCCNENVSTSA